MRINRDDGQPCMPRILLRHIVAELLRVQLLTTSVLVAVIAFGAAIRPIMQNLLGAEEVLQFVSLASIPMLQYALPFAGAFAGTIVYARLAADNEVLAMSAAGLSYRRVLLPAATLGVVLFLGMALLVDAGVPRFWTSMRRLITRDVTRLFVSAVERGEAFSVNGTQLYADEVLVIPGEELTEDGPATRLALAGVAAIETGPDGRTVTEFTAEFATVDVYRANDSAYLKLLFRNATAFREGEDALVFVPQAEPEAIDLGKGIQLEPKDLDIRGLLSVWNDVGSYHKVVRARSGAEESLAALDAWSCVLESLNTDGTLRLADDGGLRAYEARNARIEGTQLLPRSGTTFELVELERGIVTKRATVSEATFATEERPRGAGVRFELLARADVVTDVRSLGGSRWPPRVVGLLPQKCAIKDRATLTIDEVAAETEVDRGAAILTSAPALAARQSARSAASGMLESIRLVRADIVARIVQRINQALSAPLMLLLGAVLAVRLRGANPLQVYLLAFVPSIIDILLISGGEQMLKQGTSALGVFVCTSGNLAIAATIFIAYRRIARN